MTPNNTPDTTPGDIPESERTDNYTTAQLHSLAYESFQTCLEHGYIHSVAMTLDDVLKYEAILTIDATHFLQIRGE